MTKRVLFLMSDTGGGHRAAAEAISAALKQRHGDAVETELVDVFRHYSPFPHNRFPEFYPWLVNHAVWVWGIGYQIAAAHPRPAKFFSKRNYRAMRTGLQRMIDEHAADVVVSVHSVITRPALNAYMTLPERPPFLVVVTDLVTTPMFWYDSRAERTLVPTKTALERGLLGEVPAEKMRITGLPVHPQFIESLPDKNEARESLGWQRDLPAVLMLSGGDGMGPVYETAQAINALRLPCQLAIVAGRNKALKRKLDRSHWNQPTFVYPFVRQMPRLMAAADILVTKAGPATIMEACIAGLPMILSDCIPGQEEGNVTHVVENNAGVFAPKPQLVAETIMQWLKDDAQEMRERAANARRIAQPDAVWQIAEEVWHYANQPCIPIRRDGRTI